MRDSIPILEILSRNLLWNPPARMDNALSEMDGWMEMVGWVVGWMDGWMDGWRWMNGWMEMVGWMVGKIDR